jgi:hypothetical protein
MIEKTVKDYLADALDVPVWMEKPKTEELPEEYVLLEKTGSSEGNCIYRATLAIQSYAGSMYDAASLNEAVKTVMKGLVAMPEVGKVKLNTDYNFTDTKTKEYRYQAVYDLVHY